MCPYLCRIEYYDDYKIPYVKRKMNLLVYAESFDEAMHYASHYIDSIESIQIYCIGDEATLIEVSDETAEQILKDYNGES